MIELLNKDLIRVGTKSNNKLDILKEISKMVSILCQDVSMDDILVALEAREALSSTGLGYGIALPHCYFDSVKNFYIGLIVTNGIDFESIDEKPANLVFFSIGPKSGQNQHLKTLTAISKLALDENLLNKVKESKNSNQIYSLLCSSNVLEKEQCQSSAYKNSFINSIKNVIAKLRG